MARNGTGALTVQPESEEKIASPPKGVMVRRKKKDEIATTSPPLQAQAVAIAELELSFDPDLRLAMIQRLVESRAEIEILTTHEQKLSKVVELGRLAATEKAREDGIQEARAEFLIKAKRHKESQQRMFMEQELPRLMDACADFSDEILKETIESFAALLDIKLKWEESDVGHQCSIA